MPIAKKYSIIVYTISLMFLIQYSNAQFYGWSSIGTGLNNGTNGIVNAIAKYNNMIIVGGFFTKAGTIDANNIAAWDGSSWFALGSGVNDTVFALSVFNGNLIAGGKFITAGGNQVNYISRWNGSTWSSLGSGMNNAVLTLAVYSGKLIAGGRFTNMGNYISSWDGSNWSTLGSGMNNEVYTLSAPSGGFCYAGGKFTSAGGSSANRIARWNGSIWSSLGTGMNDNVYALTTYGGYIVAGGSFTQAGGNGINYLAEWNGSMWAGFTFDLDSAVHALAYYNNSLIVGGNFIKAGSLYVSRICKWDGNGCTRMITGTNNNVNFLTVIDTNLYAGGIFTTAGGDYSFHASIWSNLTTHSVSGVVRYSDTNQLVTTGIVRAERLDVNTREVIVIDSALIQPNGTYNIIHGIPDSTDVVAFPNDEFVDNFVPTYYPSSISWNNATRIYPSMNLSNINISVHRITGSSGSYSIGGHVFLNFIPPYYQPGFPFSKDAVVYAMQDTIFRGFAISDSLQKYTLTGLSPGTYNLTVDRIGYTSATKTVTLGTSNLDTINFYLDTVSLIGIQKIGSIVPREFILFQNYPNPFNPRTIINYQLPKSNFVKLSVYDILGKEVAVLVNENQAAGTYRIEWDAVKYSSGVYFYRLSTETYSETKRMVLIK